MKQEKKNAPRGRTRTLVPRVMKTASTDYPIIAFGSLIISFGFVAPPLALDWLSLSGLYLSTLAAYIFDYDNGLTTTLD